MSRLSHHLFAVLTAILLACAVAGPQDSALVAAGVALAAVATIAAVRLATGIARVPEVIVGGRSRAHRESLAEFAAPRHPATPGRRRSRAPTKLPATA